jgi:type IV pilus biogenesis protein CpaD/CtpE
MPVDLSSLPVWAVVLVLVAAAMAAMISRPRVLAAVERLWRSRATVKIVREQRRMATLVVKSGAKLQHSVSDGPELVIGTAESDANDEAVRGGRRE